MIINLDKLAELDEKGCVAFKSFIGPVSPDYVSLTIGQAKEALEILKVVMPAPDFIVKITPSLNGKKQEPKEKSTMTGRIFLIQGLLRQN